MINAKMWINGKEVNSRDGKTYEDINPATGEVLANVPVATTKDVDAAVKAARDAFDNGPWSKMTPAERSTILWKLSEIIEKESHKLAELESKDQGKTIKLAKDSDFAFGIDNIRFFASICRNLEGKSACEYNGLGTSIIRREPIGVVASITPWNYPWMMAVWKIIPAIAAGNTVVAKPASYTPLSTIEFAKLIEKAGVPSGVVNVITGPGKTVGEVLTTHRDVDMVVFTGDTITGRRIMEQSSKSVKRVQLELGGKAPFVVFDDANLEAAVKGAVAGAFVNCGQDCTAATRLYIHENIYDSFLDIFVNEIKTIRIGDPLKRETDMGPLVSKSQLETIENFIESGLKEGAKILYGGKRPDLEPPFNNGSYYMPTIFTDVSENMKIVKEEIFGPVVTVHRFSEIEEVIEKSNDVIYGLGSSVWTTDINKAFKVANALRFGEVWINDHLPLVSEMPHGGFKQTGFGKDLSTYSFDDYTEIKHIYVDLTGEKRKGWHYTIYGD
jgi:betaine-aldehyde dehydrogenase